MKFSAKKLGVVNALAVALSGGAATAAPLDQLYFSQNAGWDPTTSQFFPGSTGLTGITFSNPTGSGAPSGTQEDMEWCGINSNCSSINISSFTDGTTPLALQSDLTTLDTDGEWNEGDWWVIDTLTQTNNVLTINGGSSIPDPLWIVDTLANLRLFTDSGRTTLLGEDLNSRVTIDFWESRNFSNTASIVLAITRLKPVVTTNSVWQHWISLQSSLLTTVSSTMSAFELIPGESTPSGNTITRLPQHLRFAL